MNGCIYRTEENKCKQFSVGGVMSFCYLDGTCDCQIPSNADRIRSMSDEELADFLGGIFTIETDLWGDYDPRLVVTQEPRVEIRDKEDMMDWLKAPAEEVE